MRSLPLFIMLSACTLLAQEDAVFRIASFNVRSPEDPPPNNWRARIPRMLDVMEKYKMDSIGMQELVEEQKKALLGDGSVYAAVGVGRDSNLRGEYCCVFYRKDRFDCLGDGTFWLSETPEVPGSMSWKTNCRRICTWAKLKDKKTGKEFVHFNTHLDHVSEEARQKGAALIMSRMDDIAKDLPCFLTGDMNCQISSPAVQSYLTKMKNAKTASETPYKGPVLTYHGFNYNPEKDNAWAGIDFIFFNGDMRVLKYDTITDHNGKEYPSDHFPIIAEVILK